MKTDVVVVKDLFNCMKYPPDLIHMIMQSISVLPSFSLRQLEASN